MSVPGSNLLNLALTVIAGQTVGYLKYSGRSTNEVGQDVAEYEPIIPIRGSVQAVPRSLYQVNGLDFQKNYVTFYTSAALLDVARDVSGDQIAWNDKIYQVLSLNNWHAMDGWVGVICVEVMINPDSENTFWGFESHPNFDNAPFAPDPVIDAFTFNFDNPQNFDNGNFHAG